jgi:sterol desaturase/sphingolipid hydroxylase (fatty acid hydroxylase superfamily)
MSDEQHTTDLTLTTDEMFEVEGTRNLKWYGIPFYLSMMSLYSYLTVLITGTQWYVTPISWFVDMLVFYAWHVQAHHRLNWVPFNKVCHDWHNLHHQRFFPAKHFYGSVHAKEWVENCKNEWFLIKHALPLGELKPHESIQNESFGLFMAIIVTALKYFVFRLPVNVIVATIIQGFLVDFVGNYLHLSFHVDGHWLNQLEVYKELKYLHYEHHKGDTKHNYAIFFFGLDKFFETYVRDYKNKKNHRY